MRAEPANRRPLAGQPARPNARVWPKPGPAAPQRLGRWGAALFALAAFLLLTTYTPGPDPQRLAAAKQAIEQAAPLDGLLALRALHVESEQRTENGWDMRIAYELTALVDTELAVKIIEQALSENEPERLALALRHGPLSDAAREGRLSETLEKRYGKLAPGATLHQYASLQLSRDEAGQWRVRDMRIRGEEAPPTR
ncbi:MAG: hypothetical protein PHI49_05425 [Halothiobacillaceae bacterium]|nr:hypothetical protein [Halothiobacillaceae bacterium]